MFREAARCRERGGVPVLSWCCGAHAGCATTLQRSGRLIRAGDSSVTTVVRWSGREARALREARRMSVRAFAAHLGVAVASVTNWERRGEHIRLRHETQQILDTDLSRAGDDVLRRFAAAIDAGSAPVGANEFADSPWVSLGRRSQRSGHTTAPYTRAPSWT